jgi:hypothetical protein
MTGTTRVRPREFGDFQTPAALAREVCALLAKVGVKPNCVLEPTCGEGAFLAAAHEAFPAARLVGVDINPRHIAKARQGVAARDTLVHLTLIEGDFFKLEWNRVLDGCERGRWLILGNPPWVTSAELGVLGSANLPAKSNFHGRSGIEAMTGKSNFDISEWMLLRYLDWLELRGGWLAVLVKTGVARKILGNAWARRYPIGSAAIYPIDAMRHFEAAVDACLFVAEILPGGLSTDCTVYGALNAGSSARTIGFHDGLLISDVDAYSCRRHLLGPETRYVWRSGVKHDCSKVMELVAGLGGYRNGMGETAALEDDFVFPMLKSSDVHGGGVNRQRFMLVPQHTVGEDTGIIKTKAPLTWRYLNKHAPALGARGSSIYRNRPPFSVFGVGEYTFAPWKVAISGFYKSLTFSIVGPSRGRPVVFDDTVYFLPCKTEQEAKFLSDLLNSEAAKDFYGSMIFWSDKRPITADLLKRLSLAKLATALGLAADYERFAPPEAAVVGLRRRVRQPPESPADGSGLDLFATLPAG